MLLVDERRISPTTIEAIGHNLLVASPLVGRDEYDYSRWK